MDSASNRQRQNDAFVYREDDMRMSLTADEWQRYLAVDVETQVCVAHLVLNGTPFAEALRSSVLFGRKD